MAVLEADKWNGFMRYAVVYAQSLYKKSGSLDMDIPLQQMCDISG